MIEGKIFQNFKCKRRNKVQKHEIDFFFILTFDNLLDELALPPPPQFVLVVAPETLLTLESVEMELFSFSSSLLCCFVKWQLEDVEEGAWLLLALPLLDLFKRNCHRFYQLDRYMLWIESNRRGNILKCLPVCDHSGAVGGGHADRDPVRVERVGVAVLLLMLHPVVARRHLKGE